MSEPAKHTAGPWTVKWPDYEQAELLREEAEEADEDGYPDAYRDALDAACAVVSAPNWYDFARVVVAVAGARDATGEANANLIAAAPDLLAACKAVTAFEDELIAIAGKTKLTFLPDEMFRLARAAIAKAKGQVPS